MPDLQPHLVGKLVELRPLADSDWPALYRVASDPLIWAMHPRSDRYQESVFRAYFDEGLASGGALVVLDRATGEVIGASRYSTEHAGPGEVEIGWTFLARSRWGGDYNREMKHLMLAHAFQWFDPVIFRVGEHNLRSRRAMEKLGARLTDRVDEVPVVGGVSLHVCYAISRADFVPEP